MTTFTRAFGWAVVYLLLGALLPAHGASRFTTTAVTTYYDLQGQMANGDWVHDGAAACPREFMGATVHVIEPDVWLTCTDTGAAWAFEAGYMRVDVWALSRPWWMDREVFDVEVEGP